jgi:phosphohistidine phosphatase
VRLILFRHGIAQDRADPDCPPDPLRALTDEGVEKTRAAAAGLRALQIAPRAVWTSPYLRAVQTADLAAQALDVRARRTTEALLPDADPRALVDELRFADVDEVLCAGHAPHVDRFVAYVVGSNVDVVAVKKAGAAAIDLDGKEGVIRWVATPRMLRLMGGS